MPRTAKPVWACVCLAAVVGLATVDRGAAQERPVVIGSDTAGSRLAGWGPEQALSVSPGRLVEISEADADLGRLSGVRAHDAGPFDSQRYGFSTVHVYIDRTLPEIAERSSISSNGTLRLTVGTRAPGGRNRWWRLDAAGATSPYLSPLDITDEPSDGEGIAAATPDPSLPVLEIRYAANAFGANSGVGLERHLLLDLRGPVPRFLGLLDDVGGSIGGVCGQPSPTHTEMGCRWEGSDFLCSETLHRMDTSWAQRRGSRRFWLSSGQKVPVATRSFYKTPSELLQSGLLIDELFSLEGFGDARVIDLEVRDDEFVRMVASQSLSAAFGVQFFVGRGGQEPVAGRRLFPKQLSPEPEDEPSRDVLASYTPDSLDLPRFDVRPFANAGKLAVVQVTVTEGRGHGVYLFGFELDDSGSFVTDALLAATDAPSRGECNREVFPTTAIAMTARSAPFACYAGRGASQRPGQFGSRRQGGGATGLPIDHDRHLAERPRVRREQ